MNGNMCMRFTQMQFNALIVQRDVVASCFLFAEFRLEIILYVVFLFA